MRNSLRSLVAFSALSIAAMFAPSAAQAQSPAWPDRPVKFIIPLGPGAGVDITAR
jgi:tripartite-type tricarboxylate transporter receptor subunit TctC